VGFVGNYFVKLDGQVDALVFAGGIGEKSALLRKVVVEKIRSLGFGIDSSANDKGPSESETVVDITEKSEDVKRVLICQTDEQVSIIFVPK
jgi:acetate kinase